MDWKTRINTYASEFRQLGQELGYFDAITESYGWWATSIYLVKDNHAIQMEINRELSDLFIFVVRLKDGKLPEEYVSLAYPDGSWCREYIENIYLAVREQRNDFDGSFCDETVANQMRSRLDWYLQLIRHNTQPLLDVVKHIDVFQPAHLPNKPGQRILPPSSQKRLRALTKDKFDRLPEWLQKLLAD